MSGLVGAPTVVFAACGTCDAVVADACDFTKPDGAAGCTSAERTDLITECETNQCPTTASGTQTDTHKLKLVPKKFGEEAGYDTGGTPLTIMVGRIIKSFLGLAGIAVVVLVVYAGYQWMTAAGNEEKVTTAKKMIVQATIGLVVILMAYGIADFVINAAVNGTTGVSDEEIDGVPPLNPQ